MDNNTYEITTTILKWVMIVGSVMALCCLCGAAYYQFLIILDGWRLNRRNRQDWAKQREKQGQMNRALLHDDMLESLRQDQPEQLTTKELQKPLKKNRLSLFFRNLLSFRNTHLLFLIILIHQTL